MGTYLQKYIYISRDLLGNYLRGEREQLNNTTHVVPTTHISRDDTQLLETNKLKGGNKEITQ